VEADPRSVQALYQLARVQLLRNRRTEAIASFRKLQAVDPNTRLGRVELIALESGRDQVATWEAMTREVRDLIQKHPDQPSLRTQLGTILLSQGKTDDAEAEFRAALKIDERYAPAFLGLAQIALRRGKAEEALEFARHPLKTNPNDLQANLIAAQAETARGRMDEAAKYYEAILSVNPKITAANLALAQVQLARGNAREASRYAGAALREDPKLPGAYLVLGNVAVGERRYDEAVQHFQRVLEVQKSDAAAYAGLAYAYWRKGQRNQAVTAYRHAIELAPKDPRPKNNLAWLLADDAAHRDEALRLAQEAVSASPRNGSFVDTLGWVYYQQGNLTAAEQQFQLAVELLPKEAMAQYHLGLVAHKQGRTVEAMSALKRALLINPQFDEAAAAQKLLREMGG
jgi:tetratricopeptide (TPR) repeat protein